MNDRIRPFLPLLLLLTAFSVVFVGYHYGTGDGGYYVYQIKRQVDPSFLAHDWFATYVWYPHAFFIKGMARLSSLLPLPAAFFAIHLIERFLMLLAVFLIARRLSDDSLASLLGVLIVVVTNFKYGWPLGGNDLLYTTVIPHTLGLAAALYALLAFLEEKRRLAAALLGLTTFLHLLLGMNLAAILFAYWIFHRKGRDWKSILVCGVLYAALAWTTIFPVLAHQWSHLTESRLSDTLYIDIIGRFRSPHHYIPSSWPPQDFLTFLIYLAFSWLGFETMGAPDFRGKVRFLALACFLFAVLGTLFVEVVPVAFVMKLQLFRMTVFIKFFGCLYMALLLAERLRNGLALDRLASIAVLLELRNAPFLALTGAFLAFRSYRSSGKASSLCVAASLPLLSAALVYFQRPMWIRDAHVFAATLLLLIAGSVATYAVWEAIRRLSIGTAKTRWLVAAGAGAAITLLVPFAALERVTARGELSADRLIDVLSHRVEFGIPVESDWDRLCEWVRTHTPEDAVFIIPPQNEDFRLRAERAVVADLKSNAFEESQTIEWWERIRRLLNLDSPPRLRPGYSDFIDARYRTLEPAQIRSLARDYGAAYAVTPAGMDMDFPEVFSNPGFHLYRLPGGG